MATTIPTVDVVELQTELPRFDRSRVMDAVRPLYRLQGPRALFSIVWSWAWIAGAIAAAIWLGHWAAYLAAFVVISGRQVALLILVHEAAHHRVFGDRAWSDRVVNFFAGYPVGIVVDRYRQHHFRHHRNLNTSQDPDWLQHQNEFWTWPKSPRETASIFGKGLVGLHGSKWLPVYKGLSPWAQFGTLSRFDKATFLLFVGALLTGLALTGGWLVFAGLWLLPTFTLSFVLHHLRTVSEHLALPATHELNATRTVVSSPLERFLLAPLGINFHLEHHLFPGVPIYNLGKVHDVLMRDPEFRKTAHITASYLGLRSGLIGELLAAAPPDVTRRAERGAPCRERG